MKAPAAGVIQELLVEDGATVQPGNELFKLVRGGRYHNDCCQGFRNDNELVIVYPREGGGERKASRRNWGVRTPYCLHSCTSYCISELFISHSPGGMSAWYLYELFGLRIFIQLLIGMLQKCSHQYNNKQNILNLKKSI